MSFMDKINIWNDTVKRCNSFQFRPLKSIKYDFQEVRYEKKYKQTNIEILNKDSIDCTLDLQKYGLNPVVLNLADNCFPGGNVHMGSGAQEESLFRRSNYFQTLNLETGFYPLKGSELVYSPEVAILKNNTGNYLERFYNLSFIACPGIKKPRLNNGNFTEEDRKLFKNKIQNILNVAFLHKHEIVILGALGCGAWQCPQEEVANIFKEVLEEYNGMFHTIVFAILEVNKKDYIVQNSNLERSNYKIFKDILLK